MQMQDLILSCKLSVVVLHQNFTTDALVSMEAEFDPYNI